MKAFVLGTALGLAVGFIATCRGDELPSDDTVAAAAEAGVDVTDLLGAMNTTHLDARTYLVGIGLLTTAPSAPTIRSATSGVGAGPLSAGAVSGFVRVRLTYYTLTGRTYSGGQTYPGSTACSWNFALGTRFVFRDGETVVCNDRGLLGSSGWLDVWGNPGLVRKYGAYATVDVVP